MNSLPLLLQWIRISISDPVLEDVLETLSNGIRNCGHAIDDAHTSGNDEYASAVTDEQCYLIENLLGVAFVMCQVVITCIVSEVMRLHDECTSAGHSLSTCENNRYSILSVSSPPIGSSGFTEVQIIDAFANYFKHREEKRFWTRRKSAKTVRMITAVGASRGCTGNMRKGARSLGSSNYEDLRIWADKVRNWGSHIVKNLEAELNRLNLL